MPLKTVIPAAYCKKFASPMQGQGRPALLPSNIIQCRTLASFSCRIHPTAIQHNLSAEASRSLLASVGSLQTQQVRNRVYQSWKKSKPATVSAVPVRFKRLGNGLWIRPRSGRHKHLWRKSHRCRQRLKTHVICNKRQTWLLERMVGKYWKRHRHYPNDPYAPYHVRNNFHGDKLYRKAPFYP